MHLWKQKQKQGKICRPTEDHAAAITENMGEEETMKGQCLKFVQNMIICCNEVMEEESELFSKTDRK